MGSKREEEQVKRPIQARSPSMRDALLVDGMADRGSRILSEIKEVKEIEICDKIMLGEERQQRREAGQAS